MAEMYHMTAIDEKSARIFEAPQDEKRQSSSYGGKCIVPFPRIRPKNSTRGILLVRGYS